MGHVFSRGCGAAPLTHQMCRTPVPHLIHCPHLTKCPHPTPIFADCMHIRAADSRHTSRFFSVYCFSLPLALCSENQLALPLMPLTVAHSIDSTTACVMAACHTPLTPHPSPHLLAPSPLHLSPRTPHHPVHFQVSIISWAVDCMH